MVYDEALSSPVMVVGVGLDGEIYTSRAHGGYEFSISSASGQLRSVVSREYDPWPRSTELRLQETEYWEQYYRRWPSVSVTVSAFERGIYAVVSRGRTLWVEHSRGWFDAPEGFAMVCDELDKDGKLQCAVRIIGELDPNNDTTVWVPGGLILVRSGMLLSTASVGAQSGAAQRQEVDPSLEFYELVLRD